MMRLIRVRSCTRAITLFATLLILPATLLAQGDPSGPRRGARSTSVVAGFGNAMGWFGFTGEKYLRDDRVSLFGGLGYTPAIEEGDARGVTLAAGVRRYTPGIRHRGFLELSVSQLEIEQRCFDRCLRAYGPGAQVGYQWAALNGFTAVISGGVGYAPNGSEDAVPLVGLGFGYTWRR